MLETARKAVPDIKIEGWTSHHGPPAIQGAEDGAAAVPLLLELVRQANDQGACAIIIGCFDDTGLSEAREISICPVIGIGQAAYHMASLIGPRFSVVTTLAPSVPVLESNLATYGLDKNVGRVRASGVPVLALEDDRENASSRVVAEAQRAVDEDNIQCVVLGCAGMTNIAETYGPSFPVPMIDSVWAAIRLAEVLSGPIQPMPRAI
jgi:allantoin racemase